MAGGQSLGPMLNLRLARPSHVVSIAGLADLTAVEDDKGCRHYRRLRDACGDCRWSRAGYRQGHPAGDRAGHRLSRGAQSRHHRRQPVSCRSRGGLAVHVDRAGCGGVDAVAGRRPRNCVLTTFVAGPFRNALRSGEIVQAVRIPKGLSGCALGLLQGLPQAGRIRACHGGGSCSILRAISAGP